MLADARAVYPSKMDRVSTIKPGRLKRSSSRRFDTPAVVLASASAALCGGAFALFERTPAGLRPVLQPSAIPESGWLTAVSSGHRSFESVQESASIGVGQTVFLVMLAGALVAGVAFWSLVLTRHTQRKTELATRSALGAAPAELLRELATPLIRVAIASAIAGVVLSALLVIAALATWSGRVEVSYARGMVRAGAAALTCAAVLSAVSIGTLWLFMMRGSLADRLRAGSRATGTLGERRIRELLTSAQVGACVALLAVAVALSDLPERNDVERDAAGVWVASGSIDESVPERERSAKLEAMLRGESGFKPESIASAGAVLGAAFQDQVYTECDECLRGYVPVPIAQITLPMHSVGPNFFALTGVSVVDGREFTLSDGADGQPAVIVNASYALQMFGRRSPVGRVVRIGSALGTLHRIVGVVEDRDGSAIGAPGSGSPVIYFSALQHPPARFDLLRSTPDSDPQAIAPNATTPYVPLSQVEQEAQAPLEQTAVVLRLLAIVCFVLGAYGLHATTVALVNAQRRSLGIRRALGSTAAGLARYVSGYSARLVGVGIVLGVWIAIGAQQWLELILPSARIHADAFILAASLLAAMTAFGAVHPVWRVLREPPANPLAD